MRSFDWNSIEESGDGDFTPLPAGPYVVTIVDAIDHPDRENVEVIYDIAEGEHRGYYSDDFGKKNTWSHRFYLSYRTDGGLRMTKGRLLKIQESNPGFDPFAAWDAGRVDMFRNRIVGVNLQEVEYKNSSDELKTKLEVCQVMSAQAVRDGSVKARPKKLLENNVGEDSLGSTPIVGGNDAPTSARAVI